MPETTFTPTSPDMGAVKRSRLPAWLWAMMLATFAFGTDDAMIAGVLPAISHDLAVSEVAVGQLVTVFSLVYALSAPLWAVFAARWPRRALVTGALAVFVLANLAAAIAPTFEILMVLRVFAALAAAVTVPCLFAVAATHSPDGRIGRYLGVVMTGMTASIVLGVPVGTWVGAWAGWPATFVFAAALGVVALVSLVRTLPEAPPEPVQPLAERLSPLYRPVILLGLLAIASSVLGSMALLTYLAPFLRDLSGVGPGVLGVLFAVAGLAGLAGSPIGGRIADRFSPARGLILLGGAFALTMAIFVVFYAVRPVALPVVVLVLMLWCLLSYAVPPATSARLLELAGPAGPQALALNSSAVYLGVAGAGGIGGVLLGAYGSGAMPVLAAGAQAVAVLLFWIASRLRRRT